MRTIEVFTAECPPPQRCPGPFGELCGDATPA